jgi:hypothetical protein
MSRPASVQRLIDKSVAVINACAAEVAASRGQRFSKRIQVSPCRRCNKPTLSDVRGPCLDDRAGFCPACYAAELKWNEEHNQ